MHEPQVSQAGETHREKAGCEGFEAFLGATSIWLEWKRRGVSFWAMSRHSKHSNDPHVLHRQGEGGRGLCSDEEGGHGHRLLPCLSASAAYRSRRPRTQWPRPTATSSTKRRSWNACCSRSWISWLSKRSSRSRRGKRSKRLQALDKEAGCQELFSCLFQLKESLQDVSRCFKDVESGRRQGVRGVYSRRTRAPLSGVHSLQQIQSRLEDHRTQTGSRPSGSHRAGRVISSFSEVITYIDI